jgi:hypothetical protein
VWPPHAEALHAGREQDVSHHERRNGPTDDGGAPGGAFGTELGRAVIQAEGEGFSVAMDSFTRCIDRFADLRGLLEAYGATLLAFASQSTACNRFHELTTRLARWLLLTQDRVEADEFRLTHDLLAQMLGAHRPSVTLAVNTLQRAGLIEHSRGRVRILDRTHLEQTSCECYFRVRKRYEALLPG